ncbi:MAG: nucleoside transporter C-terminal domain-containing protein, partial [Bacteroidota bacterium]|nr:nucleoside transporter C-terminal domain-containing protein [Bacteroidota bacterium]
MIVDFIIPIVGFFIFIVIAWSLSVNRTAIDWKLVISGFGLQILLAFMFLKLPFTIEVLQFVSRAFVKILDFSLQGAQFLFGDLAKNSQANLDVKHNLGFIFAFQVLPTIIFFSSLTAGLYYLGILQKVVWVLAWMMSKTMRISGAESLSASGNIFLGQTEAPMLIKPFIKNMSPSEITCVMTGGMATLAGGVMAAYISFLGGTSLDSKILFTTSLLTASVINVPAAIVFAKILYPENQNIDTQLRLNNENFGANILDALFIGASDGVKLALNVGAMLLAFISLIALINFIFSKTGDWLHFNEWIKYASDGRFNQLSLQFIFAQIGRPLAFCMGVPWNESMYVGSLLGQKTVINEFVAYIDLSDMKVKGLLSPKSILISTFALCGFSNFSSIAIQLGGLSLMAPNQQTTISKVGMRALLAASLACFS